MNVIFFLLILLSALIVYPILLIPLGIAIVIMILASSIN